MSVIEIVAGVMLIISSFSIIFIVLSQEQKGQGLSGVITGTEMMSNESRGRSKEARLTRLTRVFAGIFVVLTLIVNIISIAAK